MAATDNRPAGAIDRLFAAVQWLLPTRLLSWAMHWLARQQATWLKGFLIRAFIRLYRVDLREAESADPGAYPSFNAFFTRGLLPGARPLPDDPEAVTSPVDGRLGAFGSITRGRLFQAKGAAYDVASLLGGRADLAAPFLAGDYATLYLAPWNYHRVHMPADGVLRETLYLPGRLFGVNPSSVRSIRRLFVRNERLVTVFDTAAAGPMAVVLVGAFCVGGIATTWAGTVTPPHARAARQESYPRTGTDRVRLGRGEELGRFNLGSTVILLFGPGAITWRDGLASGMPVRLGEKLAGIDGGA